MSIDRHKGDDATTLSRLRRLSDSVTVSYLREADNVYVVTVGYGASVADRIADADDQLPAGEWNRLCVSSPVTIFNDLQGRIPRRSFTQGRPQTLSYPGYELKTVRAA